MIPRDTRSYGEGAQRRFARFDAWRRLHRARLYWTNESRVWPIFQPGLARALQRLARWHLRRAVGDAELARRLTPDYTIGCKRVLISNDWYPMFRRPNVELVTDGIREVRERSIVTEDGREREIDCIVFGTGFVVDPRIYLQGFPVTGLPGHVLAARLARGRRGVLRDLGRPAIRTCTSWWGPTPRSATTRSSS